MKESSQEVQGGGVKEGKWIFYREKRKRTGNSLYWAEKSFCIKDEGKTKQISGHDFVRDERGWKRVEKGNAEIKVAHTFYIVTDTTC